MDESEELSIRYYGSFFVAWLVVGECYCCGYLLYVLDLDVVVES